MVRETEALDYQEGPDTFLHEPDFATASNQKCLFFEALEDNLEESLGVPNFEDSRELSESMYEGLATIKETHAKLRKKTNNGVAKRRLAPQLPLS